jgi:hypothetical protein
MKPSSFAALAGTFVMVAGLFIPSSLYLLPISVGLFCGMVALAFAAFGD